MPLQITLTNNQTKEQATLRYCHGECFDADGWPLEEAEPCDLGRYICDWCGEDFEQVKKGTMQRLKKIKWGTNYMIEAMNASHFDEEIQNCQIGAKYEVEIIEMVDEAFEAFCHISPIG
jgi:hypothetical protein